MLVLILALGFRPTRLAIDFGVYWHAAHVAFIDHLLPYGEESLLVWPMWYRYPPLFLFGVAPFLLLPLKAIHPSRYRTHRLRFQPQLLPQLIRLR